MIEMPLNRAAEAPVAAPAKGDSTPDAPQGAFEEMLSRSLGGRLVGRHAGHGRQQSQQDAAQGGGQNPSQYYQGMVVTPWMPHNVGEVAEAAAAVAVTTSGDTASVPALTPIPPAAIVPTTFTVARSPGVAAQQATVAGQTTQAIASHAAASQPPGALLPTDTAAIPPTSPHNHLDLGTQRPATTAPAGPAVGGTAPPNGTVGPTPSAIAPATSPASVATAVPTTTGPQNPAATLAPEQGSKVQPAQLYQAADTGSAAVATAFAATSLATAAVRRAGEQPARNAAIDHTAIPVSGQPDIGTTLPAAGTTGPQSAPPSQHAALVIRVMEMVEHMQTQPPPRMVVVDMPELEGLRLMVALQADGKVHVAPIAGSAPPHVAEPFIAAVGEALFADGFDLAEGSANKDRQRRREAPEQALSASPSDRRARRLRRPSGLRI